MEADVQNKNTKKILFVDQDKALSNELSDSVRRMEIESKHGYHFDHANDVKSALKSLGKETYELVVLELVLPILSGYLLVDKIKKEYPQTQIIIYTKLKGPQDLANAAASGVNDIYLKDLISTEELIKQIIKNENPENIEKTLEKLNEKAKELLSDESKTTHQLTQCSKCHLMIAPDSYFCNNCGQKIIKKKEEILMQKPAKNENETGIESKGKEEKSVKKSDKTKIEKKKIEKPEGAENTKKEPNIEKVEDEVKNITENEEKVVKNIPQ